MSLRTFSLTVALLGAIPHAAADCPADLDEDGRVDSADLGLLLADWATPNRDKLALLQPMAVTRVSAQSVAAGRSGSGQRGEHDAKHGERVEREHDGSNHHHASGRRQRQLQALPGGDAAYTRNATELNGSSAVSRALHLASTATRQNTSRAT